MFILLPIIKTVASIATTFAATSTATVSTIPVIGGALASSTTVAGTTVGGFATGAIKAIGVGSQSATAFGSIASSTVTHQANKRVLDVTKEIRNKIIK